jgi:hypothetical protein
MSCIRRYTMTFKDIIFARWKYLNNGDRNSSSSHVETQALISIDVYLMSCDVSTNYHTRIFRDYNSWSVHDCNANEKFTDFINNCSSLGIRACQSKVRLEPLTKWTGGVDKVALGQVFSEYFGFICQFSFHRLLHTHHHLSSGACTISQIVSDVPSGLSLIETKQKSEQELRTLYAYRYYQCHQNSS